MTYPAFSVSVNREQIPETSFAATEKIPDEKWRVVDKQGHGHFWSTNAQQEPCLPTLEWVIVGKQWVGDEYDGEEYDIGEWRCRLCAETIKPGYRQVPPKPVYGPTKIVLEFVEPTAPNGREVFVLTPDQYAESIEVWQAKLREFA